MRRGASRKDTLKVEATHPKQRKVYDHATVVQIPTASLLRHYLHVFTVTPWSRGRCSRCEGGEGGSRLYDDGDDGWEGTADDFQMISEFVLTDESHFHIDLSNVEKE